MSRSSKTCAGWPAAESAHDCRESTISGTGRAWDCGRKTTRTPETGTGTVTGAQLLVSEASKPPFNGGISRPSKRGFEEANSLALLQ